MAFPQTGDLQGRARKEKLQECADRKPVVIISAFHFPPLIVHFKQKRGDRGDNVGVIAGLLVCEYLRSCRAGGGLLEGSELAFSSFMASYLFFNSVYFI